MFKIIFIPSESNSNIAKDCPNCGAPIDSDLRACEYCLTPFKDSKIVWKISSIVTTYKEI